MTVSAALSRRPSCATERDSWLSPLITNANLDAVCELAVLLQRYPKATKPERLIVRAARDRMPDEASVLMDELLTRGVDWMSVGEEVPLVGVGPGDWVRDAVESADAVSAVVKKVVRPLRDDVVANDHEACARFIADWDDNPRWRRNRRFRFDNPFDPHLWLATWFAAKALTANTPQKCAGYVCDAAAHARPAVGVQERTGDRIRCRRRLVLRDAIARAM